MRKKVYRIILIIILLCIMAVIGIGFMRFYSHRFRVHFDVIFHSCREHVSYVYVKDEHTKKYKMPLPPHTALLSRISDTASIYYIKKSYEQFIDYYRNGGYDVEGSVITLENGQKYSVTFQAKEDNGNGNYIIIDLAAK